MSLFTYGIQVWGVASYSKYLSDIDKIQTRAMKYGYVKSVVPVQDMLERFDRKLWKNISSNPNNPLYDLLPKKRERALRPCGNPFLLPRIKTERFKKCFINRCLFKYI